MPQSAYKEFHSTETVLLKWRNGITLNLDQGKTTAFALLVFQSSGHNNLIECLSIWYGLADTALNWFSKCKDKELFYDRISHFMWHSPGFCVGHLLFTFYAIPLSSVIQSQYLDHHVYANDTQVYISLATSGASRLLKGYPMQLVRDSQHLLTSV